MTFRRYCQTFIDISGHDPDVVAGFGRAGTQRRDRARVARELDDSCQVLRQLCPLGPSVSFHSSANLKKLTAYVSINDRLYRDHVSRPRSTLKSNPSSGG